MQGFHLPTLCGSIPDRLLTNLKRCLRMPLSKTSLSNCQASHRQTCHHYQIEKFLERNLAQREGNAPSANL